MVSNDPPNVLIKFLSTLKHCVVIADKARYVMLLSIYDTLKNIKEANKFIIKSSYHDSTRLIYSYVMSCYKMLNHLSA